MSTPTDPEDVTELQPADLAEVSVDETPDALRPQPIEADEADAADQRLEVELEDEDDEEI
ncbi:MAG TPA: hypothetical protein VHC23_08005 [Jatrophihabitans sp.]|jgi:hypothetical protein|nr:hypothetical protein [Jatrophihabitans sp.]